MKKSDMTPGQRWLNSQRGRTVAAARESLTESLNAYKADLAEKPKSLDDILQSMGIHANIHTARHVRRFDMTKRRNARLNLKALKEALKLLKEIKTTKV